MQEVVETKAIQKSLSSAGNSILLKQQPAPKLTGRKDNYQPNVINTSSAVKA